MKYLFIELKIQDGERQHNHRVLTTTLASNVRFAAERYAASYWGYGKREDKDDYWWVNGEITIKVVRVTELTQYMYRAMSDIFSGNVRPDLAPLSDDGIPQEPTDPQNFSDLEVQEFKDEWGQPDEEINSCLDLEGDSTDYLVGDYFWLEDSQQWYPKCSSMYSEREQAIADYLRHL